jgi:hypothetical protein
MRGEIPLNLNILEKQKKNAKCEGFLIHKMKKPIVNSCHTNENMFDMML